MNVPRDFAAVDTVFRVDPAFPARDRHFLPQKLRPDMTPADRLAGLRACALPGQVAVALCGCAP